MKQIITMQSTEFAWLSHEALIKWLTTYERRPNLLIVGQGVPVEMVGDQLMSVSTRPTLRNNLPGRLQLPATPNGSADNAPPRDANASTPAKPAGVTASSRASAGASLYMAARRAERLS
jgi:hypothetical protein